MHRNYVCIVCFTSMSKGWSQLSEGEHCATVCILERFLASGLDLLNLISLSSNLERLNALDWAAIAAQSPGNGMIFC